MPPDDDLTILPYDTYTPLFFGVEDLLTTETECKATLPEESFSDTFTLVEPQAKPDVWQAMAAQDHNSSGQLDNTDTKRASSAMFWIGAASTFRGISDMALDTPEAKQTYFMPATLTRVAISLGGRVNDLWSDYWQLQSLEEMRDEMPAKEYESRQTYLEKDFLAASGGATTDVLSLGSDFSSFQGWNAASAKLGLGATFTMAFTLTNSVWSSVAKLQGELSKPVEQRNDVLIARSVQNLLGGGAALLTTLYRIVVAITGRNDLSPSQIFSLLRGRGVGGANPNYMGNQTFGKAAAFLAVFSAIAFAIHDYGPVLVDALEKGEDDTFVYNLLGMSSVLCRNIGVGLFNLNNSGAVRLGAGFIVVGCAAGMYQVSFKEHGGSDWSSPAALMGTSRSRDMIVEVNALRAQNGLPQFSGDADSWSALSRGWLNENLGFDTSLGDDKAVFDTLREFLIVAGVDKGDHDFSIVEKNSFLVLARAGDVYESQQRLVADGRTLTQGERMDLLSRILSEANVSDAHQAQIRTPSEMGFWEVLARSASMPDPFTGIGGSAFVVQEYNFEGPFLERDSKAQAAYLVLLEISDVFSEKTLGTEIWNGAGARSLRARLAKPDAQILKKQILGYDPKTTPLVLVYLEGQGITTTEALRSAMQSLPKDMELAGISEQVALMNSQLQLYFSSESSDALNWDEPSLQQLLDKTLADHHFDQLETPGGYEDMLENFHNLERRIDAKIPG